MKLRICELCSADAAVFCSSDAAFLCWNCDSNVHQANFLVARHVRQPLCSHCKNITAGGGFCAASVQPFPPSCPCCSQDVSAAADLDSLSDSSSVCISSTTSPAKDDCSGDVFDSVSQRPSKDFCKAEGIFVTWRRKLGVGDAAAIRMACSAVRLCLDRWTVLPFRVCLAASMWLGLRLCKERSLLTRQALKRLEEISGVPAKLIVAAESKLERALRSVREQQRRRRLEMEEGWAEC